MTLEEIIKNKLIKGIELKEEEIEELVDEYSIEEKISHIASGYMDMETIIEFNNKYYCICWTKGTREFSDEHEYECQPYEVIKIEKVVTDWVEV